VTELVVACSSSAYLTDTQLSRLKWIPPHDTIVGSLRQTRARAKYGAEVLYSPSQALAYIVDKAAFNHALARRALEAGVAIREGARAVTLHTEPAGVHVAVVEQAGRQYTVRAQLAIVACGVRYKLAKQLGLGMPQEFLQGA